MVSYWEKHSRDETEQKAAQQTKQHLISEIHQWHKVRMFEYQANQVFKFKF